jgi:hypothetical protein
MGKNGSTMANPREIRKLTTKRKGRFIPMKGGLLRGRNKSAPYLSS